MIPENNFDYFFDYLLYKNTGSRSLEPWRKVTPEIAEGKPTDVKTENPNDPTDQKIKNLAGVGFIKI